MSTLHMKTEEVRDAGHKLDLTVADLYYRPSRLRNDASSLRSAWQGGRASYYASQLEQMAKTLETEVLELQRLVKRLRSEVDQWEDADAQGAAGLKLPRAHVATIGPGKPAKKSEEHKEFDWFGWTGAAGLGAVSVATDVVKLTKDDYKGVGHILNKVLTGSKHGGYVGKMDKLGKLVKKSVDEDAASQLELGGYGLAFGFGVVEDLKDGKGAFHALASEGLEVGFSWVAKKAITKGVSYIIPGAGTAMLVYDLSLMTGRLAAGGLEAVGLHEQAEWLSNAIDFIDIDTYTEKLADGITDFVENTGKKFWNWLTH